MSGTEVVQARPAGQLAELDALGQRAQDYAAKSKAPNTIRAYRTDWAHFVAWCDVRGFTILPAPPEVVALYVAALAETHKPATLTRRLSAISQAHQAAGHESPTRAAGVRRIMEGIRREKGTAPDAKAPVTIADLQAITRDHLPAGLKGTRDRALLLVGLAGAFRRSELAGIDREHVEFVGEGVVITLPRSKTDQEGAGRKTAIPFGHESGTCPVGALRAWITAAGIEAGPVFRRVDRHGNVGAARLSSKAVALVVKHYMGRIGKDEAAYSGHSLRAGFCTAAAREGVEERDVMRQTGHKSVAMMRSYIRDGNLFRANAAGALGL